MAKRIILIFSFILFSTTSWCHSLDELSLTFRQSPDGVLLRGTIGQTLEPSQATGLSHLQSEFNNLDIFLDGELCQPQKDFKPVDIEESLKSTGASQSFRCSGDFHTLKVKPKVPVKWRTSVLLMADGDWSSDFLETNSHEVTLKAKSTPQKTFVTFFKEGFFHFAMGIDHIAFLLVVMFGVFLDHHGPRISTKKALWVGVKDLTFFTIGHGTAALVSAKANLSLSAQIVEPLIALTIIFSGMALSNDFPWKRRHLHFLVLPFGFIHGLSFAYALTHMGLILKSSWGELISFNLGLEFCQILIFVGSLVFVLWKSAWFMKPHTQTRLSVVFSAAGLVMLAMSLLNI